MHVVKDYDERREEFLSTAQALFTQHGYEETTISAIIQAVGVSKGAFYHYFSSKEELLDAIGQRHATLACQRLEPIVNSHGLQPLEKLNQVFNQATAFKAENRQLILTLLQVMYNDRNLRLRKQLEAQSLKASAPLIARILKEGQADGSFNLLDADEAASLILQLGSGLTERLSQTILGLLSSQDRSGIQAIERAMRSYAQAIERILGCAPDSIRLNYQDISTILLGEEEAR